MDEPRVSTGNNQDEQGFVGRVRARAGEQLTTQKDRATNSIGTVAQAVRQSAHELRGQKQDGLAEYIERSADQLERWSVDLRNKDLGDIFRDAQAFARRRPAVFVGSAFVVGLIGARFLKSSPPTTEQPRRSWQQTGGPGKTFSTGDAIRGGLEPPPERM
jgi:hypothetical protein